MKSFVLLIFLSLLFINCNNEQPQPITDSQWKVFAYLPSDTQFLVYINFNELRETQHWQKVFGNSLQSMHPGNWFNEFEQQTGLGLNKGISEVYSASTWENNNIIAVTFNGGNGVKKYFDNEDKFNTEIINQETYYYLKNDLDLKFYIPDSSTLLVTKNLDYLSQLVKRKNGSLKDNNNFLKIIRSIQSKNHYWFATDKGSYAAELIQRIMGADKHLPGGKILSSINNITLAAEFTEGVTIESNIECEDEKSAYLLSTGIRNAIAMDLLSGSNELLGTILHNMDLKRVDKIINIELKISENDILKLQSISKRQIDKKL